MHNTAVVLLGCGMHRHHRLSPTELLPHVGATARGLLEMMCVGTFMGRVLSACSCGSVSTSHAMIFTRRSTDSTVSTLEQPCKADGSARTKHTATVGPRDIN